jgi:hypothetical protein
VKAKRIIKSRQSLAEKQPGTTIFPVARVKKIIKADKDVDTMSAEATFLIAAATVRLDAILFGPMLTLQEYFIKHFMEEGYTKARLDKRKIVNYRDMGKSGRHADDLCLKTRAHPPKHQYAPVPTSSASYKASLRRLPSHSTPYHSEMMNIKYQNRLEVPRTAGPKNLLTDHLRPYPYFPNVGQGGLS